MYDLAVLDSHTHLWRHEPGTPAPDYDVLARYCEAAVAAGVDIITITEHCNRFDRILTEVFPHWERPGSKELQDEADRVLDIERGGDLDAYVTALIDAKGRGLPIRLGIEVDHLPGANEAMAALLADYPFDLHLGSVHWLGAWLFDAYGIPAFANEWDRRLALADGVDDAWTLYVDAIVELCESGVADVLAHLDVIKVAGHRPGDLSPHHRRMIDAVVAHDLTVEISSAGLRKPAGELYPGPNLLAGLVEAGATFTTASDAHAIDQLGLGYDTLRTTLADHGISELASYDGRRREMVQVA